jgi:hypothetical protein
MPRWVCLIAALVMLSSLDVSNAAWHGSYGTGHHGHFYKGHGIGPHRGYYGGPYGYGYGPYGYGYGYVVAPSFNEQPADVETPIEYPQPLVQPELSMSCHRSQEAMTVPVEGGGSRQVTVTRC